MLSIHETDDINALIKAAQDVLRLIQTGELFADTDIAKAKCTAAANALESSSGTLLMSLRQVVESPFSRHRTVICDQYSTAKRLGDLTLHLWNDINPVALGRLMSNADTRHRRIAMELITSYARHGENDGHFMDLADRLRENRRQARAIDDIED